MLNTAMWHISAIFLLAGVSARLGYAHGKGKLIPLLTSYRDRAWDYLKSRWAAR